MGYTYISERSRLAIAIFPALYLRWYRRVLALAATSGGGPATSADHAVMDDLTAAEAMAYQGLQGKDLIRVQGRVARLEAALMDRHADNAMVTAYLIISYALADLLADGRMVLIEGGPLDRAYEAIKRAVVAHEALIEGADRSATKGARRLVETLEIERVI